MPRNVLATLFVQPNPFRSAYSSPPLVLPTQQRIFEQRLEFAERQTGGQVCQSTHMNGWQLSVRRLHSTHDRNVGDACCIADVDSNDTQAFVRR